jgi:hypothetical protein
MVIKIIDAHRICAIAIGMGLLLSSGCRSSSIASRSSSDPTGGSSYFRSFDRSSRQTRDAVPSDGELVPVPDPSFVPPVPGFSEPVYPPAPVPSPSAKRSRWGLIPSGLKNSSTMKSGDSINQTSVTGERGLSGKGARTTTTVVHPSNESQGLQEQPVSSRFAGGSSSSLPVSKYATEPEAEGRRYRAAVTRAKPSFDPDRDELFPAESIPRSIPRSLPTSSTPSIQDIPSQHQGDLNLARPAADPPILLPPGD